MDEPDRGNLILELILVRTHCKKAKIRIYNFLVDAIYIL